jgi:hypothetical protein
LMASPCAVVTSVSGSSMRRVMTSARAAVLSIWTTLQSKWTTRKGEVLACALHPCV